MPCGGLLLFLLFFLPPPPPTHLEDTCEVTNEFYNSLSRFLSSILHCVTARREKATTVAFQIAFDGSHLSLHIMHYYHYYYSLSSFFSKVLIQEYTKVIAASKQVQLPFCEKEAFCESAYNSCQIHFHLLFGRRSKRKAANGNLSMSLDLKSTLRKLVLLAKATASTTESLL